MSVKNISSAILGVGVDDTTIDLFESQYPVPTGVSYNSYVFRDEKTAILDTVDARATDEWMANVTEALAGEKPAYLVVHHMEPAHGANVARLAALYPEMQVVGNAKTFQYMEQFFGAEAIAKERRVVVKDGESLSLGAHTLTFVFAPMVHWPEVMVSYESTEKVLFSADGFGRFGAVAKIDEKADWASEARRYYLNIVGKYGPQVQVLLKKAAALDIKTICPLHGPVLTGDLGKYLNYYDLWSSYKAEEPEKVLVASASIHGHTRAAAHILAEKLRAKGAKVVEIDLTRVDVSYAVTEAFRCGKTVLACATYDGFLFPPMENLLAHLKTKAYQSRTIALMETGTWAPKAAKLLRGEMDGFTNIEGVSVMAATNRADILDNALLRPGRFDRRITVDRPNLAGRLATLQVHTRNIRLAEDVNLDKIAQATAGCVGADLANLVNEAALRAVRKGRKAGNQNDLLAAFETVIAGSEKKGTVITQEEKRIFVFFVVGFFLVAV